MAKFEAPEIKEWVYMTVWIFRKFWEFIWKMLLKSKALLSNIFFHTNHLTLLKIQTVINSYSLPPFSLIRDFGKQNTRGNISKFPSVVHVIDRSDRNPPITATSVTFWPSLRHASGQWVVDFDPTCQ